MIMSQNSEKCKVLVFRSNIPDKKVGNVILAQLKTVKGISYASLDMEDWERILRVECSAFVRASHIEYAIAQLGYHCAELEDKPIINEK